MNFDSEKRMNIGSKTGQAGTGVGLPDRGCTSQLLRLTCLPVGRNEGRDTLAVEHRGSGSLTIDYLTRITSIKFDNASIRNV